MQGPKKEARDTTVFGERLRRERRRRGETQSQVAARFGIAQASYQRWEVAGAIPDVDRYADVASYLGVTVENLWEMLSNEKPASSLDLVNETVGVLERDIRDLREMIAGLTRRVDALAKLFLADELEPRAGRRHQPRRPTAASPPPAQPEARRAAPAEPCPHLP